MIINFIDNNKADISVTKSKLASINSDEAVIIYNIEESSKDNIIDTIPTEIKYHFLDKTYIIKAGEIILVMSNQIYHFDGKCISIKNEEPNPKFEDIIQYSTNEIYVFNASDYKFEFVNDSGLKNLQYTHEEIKSLTPIDIKPEHTIKSFNTLIQPLITGQKTSLDFETIHQRKDGSTYHVEVHLHQTIKGEKAFFNAIIIDITDRIVKRNELESLKETYELALEGSNDGFWDYDLVNNTFNCSSRFHEIYGLDKNIKNTDPEFWTEKIPPEERQKHTNDLLKVFKSNATRYEFETRRFHKDGHYVPILVKALISRNENRRAYRLTGTVTDISKIKQTEAALQESEAKHRYLIKSSQELICLHEPEGIYKFVSPSSYRMLGYQPHELIGKDPYSFFHPDDINRIMRDSHKPLLDNKTINNIQFRFRKKDGKYIWLDNYSEIIKDDSGNITAIFSGSRNINKLKEAEIKLENTLRALNLGIETAELGIWELDIDKNHLSWNDQMFKIFELERNDFNHSIDDFRYMVFPEDLAIADQEMVKIADGKTVKGINFRIKTKSNKTKHISASGTPIRDEQGKVIKFLGINIDVTEAKENQEALEKTLKHLNMAIDTAKLGIWEWDIESDELIWNDQALEMYELSKDSFKNHMSQFWEMIDPDDHKKLNDAANNLKNGKAIDHHFKIKTKSGVIKYINSTGSRIVESDGSVKKLFGVNQDITESLEYQKNLENALQEKETLFKELHHRIKNNLQMVISLLYLKQSTNKDPALNSFIKETSTKIHSISAIHEQLLQLQGINKLDLKDYLSTLIINLVKTYSQKEDDYKLDIRLIPITLNIDTVLNIGLIVNEIISNTIKYAFEDQKGGTILIHLKKHKKQIILIVADNGIGIDQEKLSSISHSYGLQLIKLFTEQIKGELSISNKGGTSFNIKFPLDE